MKGESTKMRMKRSKPLDLFLTFGKIGLFTFGGGYAMIPLIEREVVEKKGWIDKKDMLDVIAIAESTPGPIAINAATFIGSKAAGKAGAACATLGVVAPSFVIITVISYALEAFQHIQAVRYAFWGIRAGVLALILKALYSLFSQCEKDWFSCGVMLASFVAVACFRANTIAVILACALAGIVSSRARSVMK